MGRGRLPFSFILVLTYGAFLFVQPFADSREFRREVTCYNDLLRLDCGKSMVAVHSAYFTTAKQENHTTCHIPPPSLEHDDYIEDADDDDDHPANHSICYEDIRIAINRKCSGFKSCNYSYSQQQEKSCSSPEGVFTVLYDCVRETNVNKYCNSKILSREGYIASPGYPQYYPDLKSCSWQITAPEGQTVFLSILHVHLREASDVTPTVTSEIDFHVMGQLTEQVLKRCDEDRLTVLEGTFKRFDVCGETLDGLKKTEVDGVAGLELRFWTVGFLPASGFLAYFKVQGCPTLAAGEGSYLVERNGSAAVYACRGNNQVFNDSLESTRFLKCVRDHHWNDTLPPCITLDDATSTITMISSISTEGEIMNVTMAANERMNPILDKRVSLIGDIIIPTVIIGVLLIINGFVLVIIFMCRRRQKLIEAEFEELGEQAISIQDNDPLTLKDNEPQPIASMKNSPQSSSIGSLPTTSKQNSPIGSLPATSKQNSPQSSPVGAVPTTSKQSSPIKAEPTASKQNSPQSSPIKAEPTASKQNSPQSSPIGALPSTSKQNSPQSSPTEAEPTASKQNSPQSSPIEAEPTASKQSSQQSSPKEKESQHILSKESE